VKCAEELSANALERVRRRVYEYDAQSKEKKYALKKNVRNKIIKDKNWSMLREMFDESPPVRAIQICIFLLDINSILHGI
jgi:ornithine cyclodeaminase/alanine dehydrogenase-like protein (mu-crystallin family)